MPRVEKVDKDENGDGGKTENVAPDANLIMAQTLQTLVASQLRKVVTEDSPEYRERLVAEGFFDSFEKPVYQNGREAEARGLSAETRERACKLRDGKYIHGKVSVEHTQSGSVHLKYDSKTIEDRMRSAALWKDFPDMIDKIWSEMHVGVPA